MLIFFFFFLFAFVSRFQHSEMQTVSNSRKCTTNPKNAEIIDIGRMLLQMKIDKINQSIQPKYQQNNENVKPSTIIKENDEELCAFLTDKIKQFNQQKFMIMNSDLILLQNKYDLLNHQYNTLLSRYNSRKDSFQKASQEQMKISLPIFKVRSDSTKPLESENERLKKVIKIYMHREQRFLDQIEQLENIINGYKKKK
eukprot:169289_1